MSPPDPALAGGYQTIRVEKDGRVERRGLIARIVLDRPEVRNAFDDAMICELRQAFALLAKDRGLHAVVLEAAGTAFCAGADLNWMRRVQDYGFTENYEDALELARLLREIYDFPRPVIAKVQGPAIGGGAGLVAVCDFAVASEAAVFAFAEVRIGLAPACIAPYVLKRVGERRARRWFLTGERFGANEALAGGLVDEVAPPDLLDERVDAVVESLSDSGPEALAACKELLRSAGDMGLDQACHYTAELIARLRASPEGREGMSAFLERRKPNSA